MMDLVSLISTVGALAVLVLTLTQLLKKHLGLRGRLVLLVSLGLGTLLGALFAAGGLGGFGYLPAWPPPAGGALLGLLAGLVASGGKDTVTGLQANGAKVRAQAEGRYGPDAAVCPERGGAAPPEGGWQASSLSEMTRADWPDTRLRQPAPAWLERDDPPDLDTGP